MKFIGFCKNGKGILNEVDEPFGATATIEMVKELDGGITLFEVNLSEAKTRKPYKKREKEAAEPGVPD